MNLSNFEIGSIIGVHAPNGDQFFEVTQRGLDGPYIDRECTIAYIDPALDKEISANAMAQLHYGTGKRRRNKEMTMSDGVMYKTDNNGVLRRAEPRVSKKERRRVKNVGKVKPEGLPDL